MEGKEGKGWKGRKEGKGRNRREGREGGVRLGYDWPRTICFPKVVIYDSSFLLNFPFSSWFSSLVGR